MHVLRHHDVAGNRKEIAQADALQRILKEIHGCGRGQVRTTAIATEGEEVELPRLLMSDALAFHALRGYAHSESVGRGKCGGTHILWMEKVVGTGATRQRRPPLKGG